MDKHLDEIYEQTRKHKNEQNNWWNETERQT